MIKEVKIKVKLNKTVFRLFGSVTCIHIVPLHRPGDGDLESFIICSQHVYQVLSAGWADGPQRVGAALELRDDQIVFNIGLQPL